MKILLDKDIIYTISNNAAVQMEYYQPIITMRFPHTMMLSLLEPYTGLVISVIIGYLFWLLLLSLLITHLITRPQHTSVLQKNYVHAANIITAYEKSRWNIQVDDDRLDMLVISRQLHWFLQAVQTFFKYIRCKKYDWSHQASLVLSSIIDSSSDRWAPNHENTQSICSANVWYWE